jgi:hypothetical protein
VVESIGVEFRNLIVKNLSQVKKTKLENGATLHRTFRTERKQHFGEYGTSVRLVVEALEGIRKQV